MNNPKSWGIDQYWVIFDSTVFRVRGYTTTYSTFKTVGSKGTQLA